MLDIFGNVSARPTKQKKSATPVIKQRKKYREDMPQPQYIGQNLYIRPNYIVSLPEYDTKPNYNSSAFEANKKNLKDNKHKGKVSAKSMKEIKNAVNWLIASAKYKRVYHKPTKKMYYFKVNFITLTLPDTYETITDKIFKEELLNPVLTLLRQRYGLNNYVWKMELQENGKLHAHLTTDSFIHWSDLRRVWNRRLIKCGYMHRFKDTYGHSDPNSTDVHAVHKVNDVAAYIAKYLSKAETSGDAITGRIWGCNYELSRYSKLHLFVDRDETHTTCRPLMNPNIEYKPIETTNKITQLPQKIGEMFFIRPVHWLTIIKGRIKECYDRNCWKIRNLITVDSLFSSNDLDSVVFNVG